MSLRPLHCSPITSSGLRSHDFGKRLGLLFGRSLQSNIVPRFTSSSKRWTTGRRNRTLGSSLLAPRLYPSFEDGIGEYLLDGCAQRLGTFRPIQYLFVAETFFAELENFFDGEFRHHRFRFLRGFGRCWRSRGVLRFVILKVVLCGLCTTVQPIDSLFKVG